MKFSLNEKTTSPADQVHLEVVGENLNINVPKLNSMVIFQLQNYMRIVPHNHLITEIFHR